jgi:hypothetical protein
MLRSIRMGLLALFVGVSFAHFDDADATTVNFSFTGTDANQLSVYFSSTAFATHIPGTVTGTLFGTGDWYWGFKANAVQFTSDVSPFGLSNNIYPLQCLYFETIYCTLSINAATGTGGGAIYLVPNDFNEFVILDFGIEFIYVLWNQHGGNVISGDNYLLAQARFTLFDPEPLPLPPGLLLFAGGLGVISLFARRRARRRAL